MPDEFKGDSMSDEEVGADRVRVVLRIPWKEGRSGREKRYIEEFGEFIPDDFGKDAVIDKVVLILHVVKTERTGST